MSSTFKLQPFKAPPANAKQACVACEAYEPTCLVPDGDKAVQLCWLCAHHVVAHGASLGHAPCAECECDRDEIFPYRYQSPSESALEVAVHAAAPKAMTPRERERQKLLDLPKEKLEAWVREADKQMSPAQRAAVRRRVS